MTLRVTLRGARARCEQFGSSDDRMYQVDGRIEAAWGDTRAASGRLSVVRLDLGH